MNPRAPAVALAALLSTTALPALAQPRAEYVRPDALPSEGITHLADVALLGDYAKVDDPAKAGGLEHVYAGSLRSRVYFGRELSYAAGLDGSLGGSSSGFCYDATAYLLGLGTRWGAGNVIALTGGVGLDRYGSALPRATRFPLELSVALDLGPVRPVLFGRPAWVIGTEARKKGATPSFVDELEAGILLRLAPQHRYWQKMTAGGGFAVGASYRELMGTHAFLATLGFDFVGEQ
jgi:hypothetical protein